MYTCVYTCVYIHVGACMYTHIWVYACMYICTHTYTHFLEQGKLLQVLLLVSSLGQAFGPQQHQIAEIPLKYTDVKDVIDPDTVAVILPRKVYSRA